MLTRRVNRRYKFVPELDQVSVQINTPRLACPATVDFLPPLYTPSLLKGKFFERAAIRPVISVLSISPLSPNSWLVLIQKLLIQCNHVPEHIVNQAKKTDILSLHGGICLDI